MKKLLLFAALLSFLALWSCGDDDEDPRPDLAAAFDAVPSTSNFLEVSFLNNSMNAETYIWRFGDGTTSQEESPTHTYAEGGEYRVTLIAGAGSSVDSTSLTINLTPDESIDNFDEIGSITIGGEGAAEISAFDPVTNQLFVINNEGASRIDIIDLSDPTNPILSGENINVTQYGAGVNSVAVYGEWLAAAVENEDTQANGNVVIFQISDLSEIANVEAGPLPDMVTFTPDGSYLLAANEGEPNDDYTIDPEGSVSVIDTESWTASTATFTGFENPGNGFRVFGPGATLAQDVEPEFITVSDDSQTAYVSLQENNGLAIVDVASASVSAILGLGNKDYTNMMNYIDPSDRDDKIEFRNTGGPVVGMFQPDALAFFATGGGNYIITANEGDAREYEGDPGYVGEDRVGDVLLDPTVYPNAAELQLDENLGRLKLALSEGDTDGDGDYDLIHSYGARSFSIWNAADGSLVFDSGNDVEERINAEGRYEDGRSDDKGVEPEGVTVGSVDGRLCAFVGLERVDAVAIYDISNPTSPSFVKILPTGDAPEGLVFVPAVDSPNKLSLLIVSSEDDGTVKIYGDL